MVSKEKVLVVTSYIGKDLYNKLDNVRSSLVKEHSIKLSLSKVIQILLEKGVNNYNVNS